MFINFWAKFWWFKKNYGNYSTANFCDPTQNHVIFIMREKKKRNNQERVKLWFHQCEFEIFSAKFGIILKFTLVETTCITFLQWEFWNCHSA